MRGYQTHSAHDVRLLSLPGQFWQWRMQGGAVTLARLFRESGLRPDVILASDMLDLTTFLALTRQQTVGIPAALYFHENQLTYPMGPRQRKEVHFQLGFINYASALAADAVFFNSRFHLEAFIAELPRLLKHYPDFNELETVDLIRGKSSVLPPGLDLLRFDPYRPAQGRSGSPLIVWNHRWEYDKNPGAFLNAIIRLADEGVEFEVALTGESFRNEPKEFEAARARLGKRVVQYGFVARFADYARLLWQADVQVSTAYHDFFGISTCEAIYCGCVPLLPDRLNYPDLLPAAHRDAYLYPEGTIYVHLRDYLANPRPAPEALREHVRHFDWSQQAPQYDAALAALVS
jgi:glycosyltransferase involved in cell wall biosynthesis